MLGSAPRDRSARRPFRNRTVRRRARESTCLWRRSTLSAGRRGRRDGRAGWRACYRRAPANLREEWAEQQGSDAFRGGRRPRHQPRPSIDLAAWFRKTSGAGAASVRVRSGEGEREEWSCLLIARMKVCSIAERGPGGGRTSSSWLVRGVGDGGELACGW